jgi:GAF domain-containing protein
LASIGDLIQADRSYIFDFSLNNTIMSNTYEWCAENIEPQIDNLKNLPVENFKFFIETLTEKEIVSYSNLNQIPESENYLRQHLEKQNIQSILVIPMKKHGQLCGYLGFDSVQKEVVWDDQAIFLLRMVGDMLIKNQERLTAVL